MCLAPPTTRVIQNLMEDREPISLSKGCLSLELEAQKIHACPNDCILYHGEYENLDSCPVCNACRYKINRDDPGDVDEKRIKKRVPAKVMSYFPLTPRLKHLFMNK